VYLAMACYLIPTLGLQNDETLFANGIYAPVTVADSLTTPLGEAPLMLVSYTGSLKTWLYAAVFWLFEPSTWSIRLPVALLGAATVALFSRQLDLVSGRSGAVAGATLLATDPAFVLTVCFDWGPVALQVFLMVASSSAFVAFMRSGGRGWALLAGFLAGLALWNKALFLWNIAGFAAATAMVYHREARRMLDRGAVATIALGLAAGAWPLLLYNWRTDGATFTRNAGFEVTWPYAVYKLRVLVETLDASALFGYMLDGDANAVSTPLAGLFLGLTLATVVLPSLRRDRLLVWAAVAFWVAYLPMFVGRGVGVGSHHVALLWPLPHLAIAVAAARWAGSSRTRRGTVAVALAALLSFNVNFITRFHGAAQEGSSVIWTDAIGNLHARLAELRPGGVVFLDWGMLAPVRALGQGSLPLIWGADAFLQAGTPGQAESLLASPNYVFVDHVPGKHIFQGVREGFDASVRESGRARAEAEIIHDRAGRPVFEVFRVAPVTARSTD